MLDRAIRDLASAVLVRHIQTPITAAPPVAVGDSQRRVRQLMRDKQFDYTPIFSSSGNVIGTVSVTALVDEVVPIGERFDALSDDDLIQERATLEQLLHRFQRCPFLLTVGATGLEGVVTPADMNKQAGRVYLFNLLSSLELAMADELRQLDDDALQDMMHKFLRPGRQKTIRDRHKKVQQRDDATDLVSAMDFGDLLNCFRGDPVLMGSPHWARLKGDPNTDPIDGLIKHRNSVMHAVLDVASNDAPRVEALIQDTDLISGLLAEFSDTVAARR